MMVRSKGTMYMIVIFILCAIGVMFYSFQAVNILLTFETKIFNSYRSKLVSKKIQMAMTTREQCRDRELFMSQAGAQPGGSKGSADPPKCLEVPALAMGPALAVGPALTSTMLF